MIIVLQKTTLIVLLIALHPIIKRSPLQVGWRYLRQSYELLLPRITFETTHDELLEIVRSVLGLVAFTGKRIYLSKHKNRRKRKTNRKIGHDF